MAEGFKPTAESPRVTKLKKQIGNSKDPDTIMMAIMEIFNDTEFIPDVGMYCTFIYNPQTDSITYDEYPLVAVTDLFRWGFRGINFHWEEIRQYTWEEITGTLHVVNKNEISYLRSLKYGKIRTK